jgi:hypothetical protein
VSVTWSVLDDLAGGVELPRMTVVRKRILPPAVASNAMSTKTVTADDGTVRESAHLAIT